MRTSWVWLGVTLLGILVCNAARAETLFAPQDVPDARRSSAIQRIRSLVLRASDLASLRAQHTAQVTEFPLGVDRRVDLDLERFEPRTAGARAEVVEPGGARPLPLPDDIYFRGLVRGQSDSRVLLVAAPDHVRAWVAIDGTVYRIGLDADRVHRSYALRDLAPGSIPELGDFCGNHGQAFLAPGGGRGPRASGPVPAAPPIASFSPTLIAQVAIDTDEELRSKFSSDAETVAYVTDLVAAASTIYQTDVDVHLVASYLRIWNTTDPWSATSTSGSLDEVQNYWNAPANDMNAIAGPRDLVHFVSGKPVHGGVAYLDVLCNASYGYAVSQVYGSFDVLDPSSTWDLVVFSHETGHIFGSPHSHCYNPPLDKCYNAESGCYAGPAIPSSGTIMSYCHLSGGLAAIQLTFGPTASNLIRAHAEASSCVLAATCGDGVLSSGEDCDDGNTVSGDCCSPTCTFETPGSSCTDGNVCTSGDVCQAAGTCAGTPVTNGTPCDDGSLCTTDACSAGVCVGTAAPAVSCRAPIVPGGASLSLKDRSGTNSDSVSWHWNHGAATSVADFGSPLTTTNFELCIYDASSARLTARVPAGGTCAGRPCWTAQSTGFTYKDKDRTPDGISSTSLKAGASGSAKITLQGKGAGLGLPSLTSLALPVRVQLRSATACWGASFSTPSSASSDVFKAKSD